MLDKHFPSVYQRIQLQIEVDGRKRRYYTRVEDFDDETLTIAMPPEKEAQDSIWPGADIDAIAIAESCLYLFSARVQRVRELGKISVLVLKRPPQPKRLQRRNFFRIGAVLTARFRMLDGIDETSEEPYVEALTRDISGGGILLVIPKATRLREYVEMDVDFPDFTVHAVGRVARTRPSKQREEKVEVGVEFMRVEKEDQERIIRFVFAKQRAERAEGRSG